MFSNGNENVSQDEFNEIVANGVLEDDPWGDLEHQSTSARAEKRPRIFMDMEIVPTVGKARKGEDFWSRIDGVFVKQVEKRGTDMKKTDSLWNE